MSMRDLDRLKVIQALADRELRAGRAAERLDVRAASAAPGAALPDGSRKPSSATGAALVKRDSGGSTAIHRYQLGVRLKF